MTNLTFYSRSGQDLPSSCTCALMASPYKISLGLSARMDFHVKGLGCLKEFEGERTPWCVSYNLYFTTHWSRDAVHYDNRKGNESWVTSLNMVEGFPSRVLSSTHYKEPRFTFFESNREIPHYIFTGKRTPIIPRRDFPLPLFSLTISALRKTTTKRLNMTLIISEK